LTKTQEKALAGLLAVPGRGLIRRRILLLFLAEHGVVREKDGLS